MTNNSTQEDEASCRILGMYHSTQQSLSKELLINYIFAFVFNGILIIPTILLNVIAILTISKSSSLKEKPCYFTILVQSVIDLGVGIITIPLFLVCFASAMGEYSNCIVVIFAEKIGFLMIDISAATLLIITLERYIAILHPFGYKMLITKRRILICTLACSLVQLSGKVLSLNFPTLLRPWLLGQSTFFFLFIAFAYTRIFLVVKNLAHSEKTSVGDASAERDLTRKKLYIQDIKLAKSCFIVVLCYVVLYYLPLVLVITIVDKDESHKIKFHPLQSWVMSLGVLNSSVNSTIFFWTKMILRREAIKMLKTFINKIRRR